jgi:ureidoacrylate peracid hydrolase
MNEELLALRPGKTALLAIDMQKGFLDPDAAIKVTINQESISNVKSLMKKCREISIPIVYIQFIYSPQIPNLVGKFWPQHEKDQCCVLGHASCDIIDELKPEKSDTIIQKHGYDAFYGSSLDYKLRASEITHLIITGVTTDVCVFATVCGGFHLEYKMTIAEDGVAATSLQRHQASLEILRRNFGRVIPIREILGEIEGWNHVQEGRP